MKINPVKNPKKPEYPNFSELSKKKKSKKLVAFLAALASLATTLTGCQVQGDVAYEGVAMPPIETEQLAGDVAIEGITEVETCEPEIMGGVVVETIAIKHYRFSDDGNWESDPETASDWADLFSDPDVSLILDDGRRIKLYSGDFLVISDASPDEVFDSAGYGKYIEKYPGITFPDDKVFYTADGDTILIPDYNNSYLILPPKEDEEVFSLAGDVAYELPDDTQIAGGIMIETSEENGTCTLPEE